MKNAKLKHINRYSQEDLDFFRNLIEEKISVAYQQLNYFKDQLATMADDEDARVRGLDDAGSTIEAERLTTMAGRQNKLIQHLQQALMRIGNGTYGICRETGAIIPKERLILVPHATLSIAAKRVA